MAEFSERGRYAAVMGLIGSGHGLSHFYLLALPPLFPLIKQEFDVSYAELGLLVTLLNVSTGAFQLPAGILIDRFGARRLLGGGIALMGLCFAGIALSPSWWIAAALIAVAGLGNSVFHPADYTIINASVPEKRLGRAFSLHTFTGNVGFAAAPPVMVLLASLYGWRGGLLAAAALSLIVVAALTAFGGLLHEDHYIVRRKPRATGAGQPGSAALLFSAPILSMFMFYVIVSMVSSGVQTFSVTALVAHQGIALGTATTILTTYLVCSSIGVLLGGPLADHTRRHGLTAAAAMAVSALLVLLVASVGLPATAIAVLFGMFGMLQGSMRPARDMMTRAVTPPGATGRVFGFVSTGLNVGSAVTPVLLGWLLDLGHPQAVFYIITMVLLLGITTVGIARTRPAPKPSAAE